MIAYCKLCEEFIDDISKKELQELPNMGKTSDGAHMVVCWDCLNSVPDMPNKFKLEHMVWLENIVEEYRAAFHEMLHEEGMKKKEQIYTALNRGIKNTDQMLKVIEPYTELT